MAGEWMDFFEKTLEIAGLFYTRPDVRTYESKGGRWVESLGIYNWAFLRPTSHSNIAAELYDGKNRFASPYMVRRGQWMLDMVTAPVAGAGRAFRPMGRMAAATWCHVSCPCNRRHNGSCTMTPCWPNICGGQARKGGSGEENRRHRLAQSVQTIASQHEQRYKPTSAQREIHGHGIVLRAGVDTDEELSIHLEQVDKGPNYRWGKQATGNTGGLYFYARGQVYTAHENEIAGDHIANNLDGLTNFGVMKDGEFRTIGMNELEAPLYDFGTSQFAELRSDSTGERYVWPDYLSRSVMLAGTDYFILFDEVGTNWRAAGRFAWFNRNGEEFPAITFLSAPARQDHWMTAQTPNTRGFYRDGFGSLLTLVTHKKGEVCAEGESAPVPFLGDDGIADFRFDPAANLPAGVVPVRTAHSRDFVFRHDKPIHYDTDSIAFDGQAGLIRRFADGRLELSLFKRRADCRRCRFPPPRLRGASCRPLTRTADGAVNGRLKADAPVRLHVLGMPRADGSMPTAWPSCRPR